MTPYLFKELEGDSEHAYVHVCQACAEKHKLITDESGCDGNWCLVIGCPNTTSLVHYVWDYRPNVVEHEYDDWIKTKIGAQRSPSSLAKVQAESKMIKRIWDSDTD